MKRKTCSRNEAQQSEWSSIIKSVKKCSEMYGTRGRWWSLLCVLWFISRGYWHRERMLLYEVAPWGLYRWWRLWWQGEIVPPLLSILCILVYIKRSCISELNLKWLSDLVVIDVKAGKSSFVEVMSAKDKCAYRPITRVFKYLNISCGNTKIWSSFKCFPSTCHE